MKNRKARIYKRNNYWAVYFYDEKGKRTTTSFKSKMDAENFAFSKNSMSIVESAFAFSNEDRIKLAKIRDLCNLKNISLDVAIDLLQHYSVVEDEELEILVQLFLNECKRRNLRPKSISSYDIQLCKYKRFAQTINVLKLSQVSEQNISEYLQGTKSPAHAKRALSAFGSFCKDKKYWGVNLYKEAKISKIIAEKEPPHIISISDIKTVFSSLKREWQPLFALLAFAGIRPEELVPSQKKDCLQIENIDFENKKIIIPASVAKTREPRILENLPNNLWEWLNPLKGAKSICKGYEAYKLVRRKLPVKLKKDVFRHSFASYGYYFLGVEHSVKILGHDYKTFKKFYEGIANKENAQEYFNIRPLPAENKA